MTEAEWLKSGNPILSLEMDRGWPSLRKERLFAAACCRRAEWLAPGAPWWEYLAVAERYADRGATRDELVAARATTPRQLIEHPTYADHVQQFSEVAVIWACRATNGKYAAQAANCAACAVAYSALPPDELHVSPAEHDLQQWSAAEKAEVNAQVELVYEICGNPFRPGAALNPLWLTSDVLALARGMYESRDFGAMPILADALQDAGFDSDDVLNHCRDDGPHVRGCWVVDLLLGKE